MTASNDKNDWINLLKHDREAFNHQRAMVRALDPDARLDLRESDLTGLYLRKVDFKNTNLTASNFTDTDLRLADLRKAKLQRAIFKDTHAEKAQMQGADLRNTDITGLHLKDAQMQGALFSTREQVAHARRQGAILGDTVNINNEIISLVAPPQPAAPIVPAAPVARAAVPTPAPAPAPSSSVPKPTHAEWLARLRADPKKFTMDFVQFKRAYPDERLQFLDQNFRGFNAAKVDLRDTNFIRSDLSWANFSNAYLYRLNLRDAKARGVNFSGATLNGSDFRRADLRGVNFINATIRAIVPNKGDPIRPQFDDANLQRADLRGAKLDSATFKNADMTGVIFSSQQQVAYVRQQGAITDNSPMIDGTFEPHTLGQSVPQNQVQTRDTINLPKELSQNFPPVSSRISRLGRIDLNGAQGAEASYEINYDDSDRLARLVTSQNLRPAIQQVITQLLVDHGMVDSQTLVSGRMLELSNVVAPSLSEGLAESVSLEFVPYGSKGYLSEIHVSRSKWQAGLNELKRVYPECGDAFVDKVHEALGVLQGITERSNGFLYMPGDQSKTITPEQFVYQFMHSEPMHDTGNYRHERAADAFGFRIGSNHAGKNGCGYPDILDISKAITDISQELKPGCHDFVTEMIQAREEAARAASSPKAKAKQEGWLSRLLDAIIADEPKTQR